METPVSPAATGGDADCLHNKSLAAHPPPSPFYISTSATKSSFKWSSTLILKASSKQHCTCHNIFIQTHVRFVVLTEPESHQLSLQKVFQNRNRQTSGSIDHTSGSNKKGKTNVTKHMYFEQKSGNLNKYENEIVMMTVKAKGGMGRFHDAANLIALHSLFTTSSEVSE